MAGVPAGSRRLLLGAGRGTEGIRRFPESGAVALGFTAGAEAVFVLIQGVGVLRVDFFGSIVRFSNTFFKLVAPAAFVFFSFGAAGGCRLGWGMVLDWRAWFGFGGGPNWSGFFFFDIGVFN